MGEGCDILTQGDLNTVRASGGLLLALGVSVWAQSSVIAASVR